MSAMKFVVGEPKKLTLAFDEPKTGTNSYGAWYMYGFKNGDLSSEEDCFFATSSLHAMIQTLGAGGGDEITIEKCEDGEITFFKVNGLTLNDMNSGGSIEKIAEAKPSPPDVSLESNSSTILKTLANLRECVETMDRRLKVLEDGFNSSKQLTDADIPF